MYALKYLSCTVPRMISFDKTSSVRALEIFYNISHFLMTNNHFLISRSIRMKKKKKKLITLIINWPSHRQHSSLRSHKNTCFSNLEPNWYVSIKIMNPNHPYLKIVLISLTIKIRTDMLSLFKEKCNKSNSLHDQLHAQYTTRSSNVYLEPDSETFAANSNVQLSKNWGGPPWLWFHFIDL